MRLLASALAAAFALGSGPLVPPVSAQRARPPFDPAVFGINVNEALVSPLDKRHSEAELRRQVGRIVYEARRIGARLLRWPAGDVWPQYECSRDPENQATGALDSAWYAASRALLEEAQRQGVEIVAVLADLSNDSFIHLPREPAARAALIAGWARYRAESAGADRYPGDHRAACLGAFRDGYYGVRNAEEAFVQPAVLARFGARFARMAAYLRQFPALGALELFNEPPSAVMHQDAFGAALVRLRRDVAAAAPGLPVYSGVPWWDRTTVGELARSGELAQEPFVAVHNYLDYTARPGATRRTLDELVAYMRGLVPDRPIVFGEAGSKTPLPDLRQHAAMLGNLLAATLGRRVGLWAWGSWVRGDEARAPDYKWAFNPRSLAGVSFRRYFADRSAEERYAQGRAVLLAAPGGVTRSAILRVSPVGEGDPDPALRLRWRLVLDAKRFTGFDRLGLFAARPANAGGFFGTPPGAVLIADKGGPPEWAEVAPDAGGWRLRIFACVPDRGVATTATPLYLVALALDAGREEFRSCTGSALAASARL